MKANDYSVINKDMLSDVRTSLEHLFGEFENILKFILFNYKHVA